MRPAVRTRFCAMALAACLLAVRLLTWVAATSASASPVGEGSSQARTLATRLAALGSPRYLLGNINDTLTPDCLDPRGRLRHQRRPAPVPPRPRRPLPPAAAAARGTGSAASLTASPPALPMPRCKAFFRHVAKPMETMAGLLRGEPGTSRVHAGRGRAGRAPWPERSLRRRARSGTSDPAVPARLPAGHPATRPPGHPATRPASPDTGA